MKVRNLSTRVDEDELIYKQAWQRQGRSDALNGFSRTQAHIIPAPALPFYEYGYKTALEELKQRHEK